METSERKRTDWTQAQQALRTPNASMLLPIKAIDESDTVLLMRTCSSLSNLFCEPVLGQIAALARDTRFDKLSRTRVVRFCFPDAVRGSFAAGRNRLAQGNKLAKMLSIPESTWASDQPSSCHPALEHLFSDAVDESKLNEFMVMYMRLRTHAKPELADAMAAGSRWCWRCFDTFTSTKSVYNFETLLVAGAAVAMNGTYSIILRNTYRNQTLRKASLPLVRAALGRHTPELFSMDVRSPQQIRMGDVCATKLVAELASFTVDSKRRGKGSRKVSWFTSQPSPASCIGAWAHICNTPRDIYIMCGSASELAASGAIALPLSGSDGLNRNKELEAVVRLGFLVPRGDGLTPPRHVRFGCQFTCADATLGGEHGFGMCDTKGALTFPHVQPKMRKEEAAMCASASFALFLLRILLHDLTGGGSMNVAAMVNVGATADPMDAPAEVPDSDAAPAVPFRGLDVRTPNTLSVVDEKARLFCFEWSCMAAGGPPDGPMEEWPNVKGDTEHACVQGCNENIIPLLLTIIEPPAEHAPGRNSYEAFVLELQRMLTAPRRVNIGYAGGIRQPLERVELYCIFIHVFALTALSVPETNKLVIALLNMLSKPTTTNPLIPWLSVASDAWQRRFPDTEACATAPAVPDAVPAKNSHCTLVSDARRSVAQDSGRLHQYHVALASWMRRNEDADLAHVMAMGEVLLIDVAAAGLGVKSVTRQMSHIAANACDTSKKILTMGCTPTTMLTGTDMRRIVCSLKLMVRSQRQLYDILLINRGNVALPVLCTHGENFVMPQVVIAFMEHEPNQYVAVVWRASGPETDRPFCTIKQSFVCGKQAWQAVGISNPSQYVQRVRDMVSRRWFGTKTTGIVNLASGPQLIMPTKLKIMVDQIMERSAAQVTMATAVIASVDVLACNSVSVRPSKWPWQEVDANLNFKRLASMMTARDNKFVSEPQPSQFLDMLSLLFNASDASASESSAGTDLLFSQRCFGEKLHPRSLMAKRVGCLEHHKIRWAEVSDVVGKQSLPAEQVISLRLTLAAMRTSYTEMPPPFVAAGYVPTAVLMGGGHKTVRALLGCLVDPHTATGGVEAFWKKGGGPEWVRSLSPNLGMRSIGVIAEFDRSSPRRHALLIGMEVHKPRLLSMLLGAIWHGSPWNPVVPPQRNCGLAFMVIAGDWKQQPNPVYRDMASPTPACRVVRFDALRFFHTRDGAHGGSMDLVTRHDIIDSTCRGSSSVQMSSHVPELAVNPSHARSNIYVAKGVTGRDEIRDWLSEVQYTADVTDGRWSGWHLFCNNMRVASTIRQRVSEMKRIGVCTNDADDDDADDDDDEADNGAQVATGDRPLVKGKGTTRLTPVASTPEPVPCPAPASPAVRSAPAAPAPAPASPPIVLGHSSYRVPESAKHGPSSPPPPPAIRRPPLPSPGMRRQIAREPFPRAGIRMRSAMARSISRDDATTHRSDEEEVADVLLNTLSTVAAIGANAVTSLPDSVCAAVLVAESPPPPPPPTISLVMPEPFPLSPSMACDDGTSGSVMDMDDCDDGDDGADGDDEGEPNCKSPVPVARVGSKRLRDSDSGGAAAVPSPPRAKQPKIFMFDGHDLSVTPPDDWHMVSFQVTVAGPGGQREHINVNCMVPPVSSASTSA